MGDPRQRSECCRSPIRLLGGKVLRLLTAAVVVPLALSSTAALSPADANWLTKIVRESGEASSKGTKPRLGALGDAALYIKALPDGAAGSDLAFAAHAGSEGHWTFVNKNGDVFTAGTPDEMKRVTSALAPEATAGAESKLALYLSDQTVFQQRSSLKDLPKGARLSVVIGNDGYPLVRRNDGRKDGLQDTVFAELRSNLMVSMHDERLFREAIWQLSRPLSTSYLRVLALEAGGPDRLAAVPRFDPATKGALVDRIDPNSLGAALSGIRGQTAVLTARVEAGQLRFVYGTSERSLPLAEIERAAAGTDVNLVILQSSSPRQPGGRNWLWQTVTVDGLDNAMKRATFADFLNALGASRGGRFSVDVVRSAAGRTVLRALPVSADARPIGGQLEDWAAEFASAITGNVLTSAVEFTGNSEERQSELDHRVLPGIPSAIQMTYLAGLFAGILGLGVVRDWWRRLWPAEIRKDYSSAFGYHAARAAKLLAFGLLFLPLAGVPGFAKTVMQQLWRAITWPNYAMRWIVERFVHSRNHASG